MAQFLQTSQKLKDYETTGAVSMSHNGLKGPGPTCEAVAFPRLSAVLL